MNTYEAIGRATDCIMAYVGDGALEAKTIRGSFTVNEVALIHVATLIMDTLESSKIDLASVLKETKRERLMEDDPEYNDIPSIDLGYLRQRLKLVADRTTDGDTLDALEDIIKGLR